MTNAPSGDQFEIAFGDQRAVITEVGGGLRSYTADERPVLDGYGADEMCPSGRGQVLAPWPNRLEDGTYDHDGARHQLPLDEPERHNAIHGLVRWDPWTRREQEPQRVVLDHTLHPRPGYPFTLTLTVAYVLSADGLTVTMTAVNDGRDTCPYGVGMHPYLTLGSPIDALVLSAPARTVLQSDERGLPRTRAPVDGTEYDFQRARPIGTTVLDHCFTDLERGDDGRARIQLEDPVAERRVTIWLDEHYPFVMLFTGDPLPDVARRALAVEPMTCPPNAFRTGEHRIDLEPAATVTGTWGITPSTIGDR